MTEKKSFGLIQEQGTSWIEGADDEPGRYDEMQPGGICHYDGPEAKIPLGLAWTNVPGWSPEKAAVSWEVEAPILPDGSENPAGVILKKTTELTPEDIITGVVLNKASLARHDSLIQDANANKRR